MPLNVSIKDSGDIMVEMMEAHLKSFMNSKIIKKKNKLILNNYIKKNFWHNRNCSNHTIFYSD